MNNVRRKTLGVFAGILFLAGSGSFPAQMRRVTASATADAAIGEKVIRYIRERFAVPDAVKMSLDSFRNSAILPGFNETTVTVDDGKQKRVQSLYVSKNNRFLVVGSIFTLSADPKAEIARYVREMFKVPETMQITVGDFRKSIFPNFLETTLTVDDGKNKQTQVAYVTGDNHIVVLGNIFNLSVDPRREAAHTISLVNQSSQGPASAPVTIVEYSDLQCPMCARFHEFLEKSVLPKYGDKVRIVFKESPLITIHDWALTGAIACQCAYQLDPTTFAPFRSLIFQHQASLNATNARGLLIEYGEQAGIDRLKLAACIDAKASLPRIEENLREASALGVVQTPTSYINGKVVVGMPAAEEFYKAVDEALRAAK